VQRIRAWADAIVVGAGTVVTDDPLLTVRDETFSGARRPIRVVVDASGRVPPQARALAGPIPTLIATTERAPRDRIEAWAARGAEVLSLDPELTGDVPLGALFRHLGKRDVQGVLIEGGQSIAWSAVRDGLVDHICIYVAPLLVGGSGAPGILGGSGFSPIDQALRVDSLSVVTIGRDLKLEADVQRNR
jgi:diaminohydroxyphosphoribosylaminopyrimidine deaminase/5-amino-6-(5-phosphoribosylamino)uracil reductase